MKNASKKLLSIVLVTIMFVAVFPLMRITTVATGSVPVASGAVNAYVNWAVTDSGMTLTFSKNTSATPENGIYAIAPNDNYLIDNNIAGNCYTRPTNGDHEGGWASYIPTIQTVIIDEGITHIARYAFGDYAVLERVSIPSTLEYIGYGAFIGDVNLRDVDFAEGGTKMLRFGNNVFDGCQSIRYIRFPSNANLTHQMWAATGNDVTCQSQPQNMFNNCKNLTVYITAMTAPALENYAGTGCTYTEWSTRKNLISGVFANVQGTGVTLIACEGSFAASNDYLNVISNSSNSNTVHSSKSAAYQCIVIGGVTPVEKNGASKETVKTNLMSNILSTEAFSYHEGKLGIRAMITADEGMLEILQALSYTVEYGAVAANSSAVQDGVLSLNDTNTIYEVAFDGTDKKVTYASVSIPGKHVYTAVLYNVDRATPYVLTGYVKIGDDVMFALNNTQYYVEVTSNIQIKDFSGIAYNTLIRVTDEQTQINKQDAYNYITEIYNSDKTLAGAKINSFGQNKPNAVNEFLTEFKNATGKEPALLGLDVYEGNYDKLTENQKQNVANQLAEYYRRGGMISISSHMSNPAGTISGDKYRGDLGDEDAWEDVISEGEALNTELKEQLAIPLDLLTRLDQLGVPVFWRPYHEMSSSEFWWGTQLKATNELLPASCYQELWKYTYEYFTTVKELDNLIWVYAPTPRNNIVTQPDGGAMYCYPGDAYVDVIGLDCYFNVSKIGDSYKTDTTFGGVEFAGVYEYIETNYNKPIVISEAGYEGANNNIQNFSSADYNKVISTLLADGKGIGYVMFWSGQNLHEMSDKGETLLANTNVLTLDKKYLTFLTQ